jgi:hypothetical protein
MSVHTGPRISTDGLVLLLDSRTPKSFMGEATTNYAWSQNPRIDATYAPSFANTGSWNTKHTESIAVYNVSGSSITSYTNGGVVDYANTYHAFWVYDAELGKPVVLMKDLDTGSAQGAWKAKSWATSQTMTTMGLASGSKYTISWNQWTSHVTKSAQAGLYGPDTGSVNNFWDGQSNSQATAFNTKAYTWQRVYATFGVSPTRSMTGSLSCYMYGMYGGNGYLKISDVQIESKDHPTRFCPNIDRGAKASLGGGWQDLSGYGNHGEFFNFPAEQSGSFVFDGVDDYCFISGSTYLNTIATGSFTLSLWAYRATNPPAGNGEMLFQDSDLNDGFLVGIADAGFRIECREMGTTASMADATITNVFTSGSWNNLAVVKSGSIITGYSQGNYKGSFTAYQNLATSHGGVNIGRTDWWGPSNWESRIDAVRFYNRPLSATEILQIYNANKSRFGL